MRYLFEDMDVLRQKGFIRAVPSYVTENLRYTLRPYQLLALENFITFYESDTSPRPLQVLFHMATGSGKTLVMAGLIVYLYQQGYRDFLFFVNLSNIVEKTRCNFITPTSPKYLFRDPVVIDGQKVSIRQVNNFQSTTKDAINICFATTQGLHMDLWQPHENRTTWEDFVDRKTVLISDEAHHLNVETARRRSRSAETDLRTWEETARRILEANRSNVLLEFTATCDLSNPYIENEYRQKIIANYPLRDYYRDGYSKDIVTHRAHADRLDRALHAVILSEYRQRLFADCGLRVKPVVLFKARTIPESEEFERSFRIEIAGITADRLDSVLKGTDSPFVAKAVQYFEDKGISLQQLAAEIRDDFGPEHCISVNEQKQAVDYQIALNTLESPDNPYRAIFEVRKLDEGWDVLNLFDIVRLYETRQSGGNRTSRTTISEAQLIGRGARYFPFALEETDDEFLRKFDQDVTNDLRVCEQLLYHCQNDSRYIAELQNALREIGLDSGNVVERHLTLKPEFKQTEIYRNGWLFLNKRVEKSREDITSLPENLKCSMFWIRTKDGTTAIDRIMDDVPIAGTDTAPTYRFTVAEIAQRNYNIVRKALVQRPLLRFDELRRRFPNLRSMSQFILDDAYMGGISLHVRSNVEPTGMELFQAMVLVAKEIAEVLEATHVSYEGTRTFYEREIRALFRDKVVKYAEPAGAGAGISQNDSSVPADMRTDLAAASWFAFNDNYGTSEEKAFVAYFKDQVPKLAEVYKDIWLVRNERQVHIYSFCDGDRFEPDFVLFLRKRCSEDWEQLQVFIEPKGQHLLQKDQWKQDFLLEIRSMARPVPLLSEDTKYRIWGLPFYTQQNQSGFDKAFAELYKGDS